DDDYEALEGYSDRELPRLIVDTRTRCHRGRFHVRQLDPPQQTLPNADQWPSECSALPLAASFSVCRVHDTELRRQLTSIRRKFVIKGEHFSYFLRIGCRPWSRVQNLATRVAPLPPFY